MMFVSQSPSIHEVCSDFISYCLDLIQYALCFRCAVEQGTQQATKRFHHCGRIYTHLTGSFPSRHLVAWESDLEHGLFHGLCTALMAGLALKEELPHIKEIMSLGGEHLRVKEKNLQSRKVSLNIEDLIDPETYSDYQSSCCKTPISFEKVMASCVLHDFVRAGRGIDEGHDVMLKKVFPNLDIETYSHARPPHHDHPLLMADVLELRRFDDHAQWYDPSVVEPKLSKTQTQIADHFYRCVRPALQFAYAYRYQPWLAHGPEVEFDSTSHVYPQHPVEWAAVETDRLPFQACFCHDQNIPSAPWGKLRAAIPHVRLRQLGGDVKPHMESYRDHLFVKADTSKSNWMFVTNKNAAAEHPWLKPAISSLSEGGAMLVELEVLNKFIRLTQTLRDRILILGCANLKDELYLFEN